MGVVFFFSRDNLVVFFGFASFVFRCLLLVRLFSPSQVRDLALLNFQASSSPLDSSAHHLLNLNALFHEHMQQTYPTHIRQFHNIPISPFFICNSFVRMLNSPVLGDLSYRMGEVCIAFEIGEGVGRGMSKFT